MAGMIRVALMLVVLALMSGAALAQDVTPEPTEEGVVVTDVMVVQEVIGEGACAGLSPDDCAQLELGQQAEPVTSSGFVAQMVLSVSDPEEQDALRRDTMALSAVGRYNVDQEALSMVNADVTGVERARDLLNAVDVEATVTLYLPVNPAGGGEATVSAVTTFDLLIVDGLAYVNFDGVEGEADEDDIDGWYNVDLDSLVGELGAARAGVFSRIFSPGYERGVRNQDVFGTPNADTFSQRMRSTTDPDLLVAMVGEEVAVFQTIFDLGGYYSDPATEGPLMDLLETEAELRGEELNDPDAVELFENRRSLFGDSVVRFVDYIALDDGQLLRQDLVVDDLVVSSGDVTAGNQASTVTSLALSVVYVDINMDMSPINPPMASTEVTRENVSNAFGLNRTNDMGMIDPALLINVGD